MSSFKEDYRRLEFFVKIMPFIVNTLYIISLVCYIFIEGAFLRFIDLCFNFSPVMLFFMVCLSYLTDLCRWHRVACLIPLLYFLMVVTHRYIHNLTEYRYSMHSLLIVSSLLCIIAGLKVLRKKD